jgi:hypothetical protein
VAVRKRSRHSFAMDDVMTLCVELLYASPFELKILDWSETAGRLANSEKSIDFDKEGIFDPNLRSVSYSPFVGQIRG